MNSRLKNMGLAIVLIFGSVSLGTSQEARMVEAIMLTPNNAHLKVLSENMRKHNQTYHPNDSPHRAAVYNVANGPNSGNMIWTMGPMTNYATLDSRPSEGGHDEDWRDNVMPYVKEMGAVEYWNADMELSHIAMLDGDNSKYPMIYVRYFNVAEGNGHQVDNLLKQMSATRKAMGEDKPWGIYDNEFRQGWKIGRHLASVSFMKNWAQMDEPGKFKETFISLHGESAWQPYVNGMQSAFSDAWDEIWTYSKELSGH